jgi:hypothetical protein
MSKKRVSLLHNSSGQVAEAERVITILTDNSDKRVIFGSRPHIPETELDRYYLIVGGDSEAYWLKDSGWSDKTSRYYFNLITLSRLRKP